MKKTESAHPAPGREASLEQRLERLDAIVDRLDADELELEEALGLFEEGMAHLRAAERLLREGELRVQRLIETANGVVLESAETVAE